MKIPGTITVTNRSAAVAVIDIEGIIGIPEEWQFEEPGTRVATYETFRKSVAELKGIDNPEVIVNIRSTGGNVNDALLIFDTLAALDADITTRCFGYVASAATIIAQAASAGKREISGNCLYLIHRSVCATEGNSNDLVQSVEMLGKTDERIAGVYAGRSGREAANFSALMDENDGKGRWLSPEETLEWGLADRIIGRARIGKSDRQEVRDLGLPEIPTGAGRQNTQERMERLWNAVKRMIGAADESGRKEEGGPEGEEAAVEVGAGEVAAAAGQGNEGAVAEMGEKESVAAVGSGEMEVVVTASSGEVAAAVGPEKEVAAVGSNAPGQCSPAKNEGAAQNAVAAPEDLKARISSLEASDARGAVGPTRTMPKEDPSPQEVRRSPNAFAYEQDSECFRP